MKDFEELQPFRSGEDDPDVFKVERFFQLYQTKHGTAEEAVIDGVFSGDDDGPWGLLKAAILHRDSEFLMKVARYLKKVPEGAINHGTVLPKNFVFRAVADVVCRSGEDAWIQDPFPLTVSEIRDRLPSCLRSAVSDQTIRNYIEQLGMHSPKPGASGAPSKKTVKFNNLI